MLFSPVLHPLPASPCGKVSCATGSKCELVFPGSGYVLLGFLYPLLACGYENLGFFISTTRSCFLLTLAGRPSRYGGRGVLNLTIIESEGIFAGSCVAKVFLAISSLVSFLLQWIAHPSTKKAQQWLWIPRSSVYYEVSASTVSSTACSREVRAYSDSMRACTAFLKAMQTLTAN